MYRRFNDVFVTDPKFECASS